MCIRDRDSYINGNDQALSLIYKKQATPRLRFTLKEAAGILNRNLFSGLGVELIDPNFSYSPKSELFDGRTEYLNTMLDVTYHRTARLSFNFAGDGFLTRRWSSSLY